MITGTDISRWQSAWKPAPTDSFVFIESTIGHTYVSPPLHNQAATARRANLVVGFYHLLWPASQSVRPEAQAAWFVQNTPCQLGDLLVCDWEPTSGSTAPEAEKDAFIAEVKRLRPEYHAGLYVNRSMWNTSRKWSGDFLWIAEYGVPSPTIREPWTFWQSSDKTAGQALDFDHGNFPSKQALKDWADPMAGTWKDWSEAEKSDLVARVVGGLRDTDPFVANTIQPNPAANPDLSFHTWLAAAGEHLLRIRSKLGA